MKPPAVVVRAWNWFEDAWYALTGFLFYDAPGVRVLRRRADQRRLDADRRILAMLPPESKSRPLLAASIARREETP